MGFWASPIGAALFYQELAALGKPKSAMQASPNVTTKNTKESEFFLPLLRALRVLRGD
jgi:hypothetical protein